MIGTRILNYKITAKIGQGGMASVYEAHHITFENRKVAIKILDPILSKNEDVIGRFINEAKMMASLEHPNIVKVIDFESGNEILAIIMEFLDGQDLKNCISKNLLNEENKLKIFKQTLQAINYGHKRKIVHRDIKPSNIFVVNNLSTAKVLDFGIAKMLDSDKQKTATGLSMGTPMYMSPEQVKGLKEIDQRSDIYSLGVLLYYIFSGQTPYDTNDSQYNILTKIVNDSLPEINGNDKINYIVKKATAKNPNERYQNCQEFIDAFENSNELSGFISINQELLEQNNEKSNNVLKHKVEEKSKTVQDIIPDLKAKEKSKNVNIPIQNNSSNISKLNNDNFKTNNVNQNNSSIFGKKPKNYLILSIIVTLLFCLPLGIFALITGSQVNNKFNSGDIEGAKKSSEKTKKILIVTVVVSIIFYIILILIESNGYDYY